MPYFHKPFAHIYVERAAKEYHYTQELLQRFRNSQQIEIESYKEVFNRPKQDFAAQKLAPKLILAKRTGEFFYPGSAMSHAYGYRHFYYNTLAMNCVFDCKYCYLQGLYPSANLVLFVNVDDYLDATSELLSKESPLFMCISYDTDLLALESFIPYSSIWANYASEQKDLLVEIRTKSANIAALNKIKPNNNVVLAWSLSPQEVTEAYELGTASLSKRLSAISEAIRLGWQVRLCFDPIMYFPEWNIVYKKFIEQVLTTIPISKIFDISLGCFRINKEQFKSLEKRHFGAAVLDKLRLEGDQVCYPDELKLAMRDLVGDMLRPHFPENRVFLS